MPDIEILHAFFSATQPHLFVLTRDEPAVPTRKHEKSGSIKFQLIKIENFQLFCLNKAAKHTKTVDMRHKLEN